MKKFVGALLAAIFFSCVVNANDSLNISKEELVMYSVRDKNAIAYNVTIEVQETIDNCNYYGLTANYHLFEGTFRGHQMYLGDILFVGTQRLCENTQYVDETFTDTTTVEGTNVSLIIPARYKVTIEPVYSN